MTDLLMVAGIVPAAVVVLGLALRDLRRQARATIHPIPHTCATCAPED